MRRVLALLTVSTVFAVAAGIAAGAPVLGAGTQGTKISEDPYTDPGAQHKTQVEPDTFAFGQTIVSVFQSGRTFSGGASNIGWATSTDGGASWTNGFMPGTTPVSTPPGIYTRVSDPAVAYDPKRRVWMASILGLKSSGGNDIITSRSTDGGLTWNNPVNTAIGPPGSFYDKNWIACDTSGLSPFFGNCYTQWDDAGAGNLMLMSTSTDGGLTWGPPKSTANMERGTIGGQVAVLSTGRVVVPFISFSTNTMRAFNSTDGGNTWSAPVVISTISYHIPAGGIRAGFPLPSAESRSPGPVVVVWPDCRFEPGCSANDLVMSLSSNGVNWSAVTRIPLDPIGSGVDHFIPGLAVQPAGTTETGVINLAVAYYYYPVSNCNSSTCRLHVGFSSSRGGANWTPPVTIAGPMQLSWLASTSQGRMVGDYISASFSGNNVLPVYAEAFMPTPPPQFQEHTFTTLMPTLSFTGPTRRASSAGAIYGGAKHGLKLRAGFTLN